GDSLFAGIEVGEVFFNYYRNRQVTTKIMEENYNFLKFFVKKSLEFRNESAVWRALTRDQNISSYERYDAACMFEQYFDQLTEKTKKEIIREGLTQRNHDILAKLAYTIKNKNIVFEYDDKQLSLADHIDGWEFALPKDSYQLKDIGMSLHNCVASYVTSVKEKDCTIVYATKDEQYKLCIEVRELYILQCRTDRNGTPKREAFEVVKKWSKAHGLTFEKNSL
ncbi:MAG: PcfJ domain-containing protein, partial [Treponema sp.]|nr:PcfJ domain-containing protein [Treponema sp.]